jgi:phenylacetate-CoA ligase
MLVEAQRDFIGARVDIDPDSDTSRFIGSSFGVGELGLNLLFETRETVRIRRAMRRDRTVEKLVGGRTSGRSMPSVFCYNPLRCHVEILQPDEQGYGPLCFTVSDPDAVIPLPRFVSGDYGRLVSRPDVVRAASLAGSTPPWLPVALVCGRISDYPLDLPSIEEIKEILYEDHTVAARLTGAFYVSKDSEMVTVAIQAATESEASDVNLKKRVADLVNENRLVPLKVRLLDPHTFPRRPILDFERKVRYLCTTEQAAETSDNLTTS